MADKRVDIVELKGDNYPRWRNDLQVALIIAQCEGALAENRPQEISQADWDKLCQNARALILKALRDEFWRVSPGDSPFLILQKIEAEFQPTSSLITILKICKFFNLADGNCDGDIVKEVTSSFSELRRAIDASAVLRENVIIDESIRTAILAFALEKIEPTASSQIKERFERNEITFEQAKSLLAEVRVTHRKAPTGLPSVSANSSKRCEHCDGAHPLSKCWFNDPSLAPERIRAKICKYCKKVGHATKDCQHQLSKANSVRDSDEPLLDGKNYCFGLRHVVSVASSSSEFFPVILDSGCTTHMMCNRTAFSAYKEGAPITAPTVYTASGQPLSVAGHGTVVFQIRNARNGKEFALTVNDVLHVPSLQENILSLAALDKKGVHTTIANQKMILRHKGAFVASASLSPNTQQYHLDHQM